MFSEIGKLPAPFLKELSLRDSTLKSRQSYDHPSLQLISQLARCHIRRYWDWQYQSGH